MRAMPWNFEVFISSSITQNLGSFIGSSRGLEIVQLTWNNQCILIHIIFSALNLGNGK